MKKRTFSSRESDKMFNSLTFNGERKKAPKKMGTFLKRAMGIRVCDFTL